MEIEKKLELNKAIRKYEGTNSFIISLQKQLRAKYVTRIEHNGRTYKILSDKQYDAAFSIFNNK